MIYPIVIAELIARTSIQLQNSEKQSSKDLSDSSPSTSDEDRPYNQFRYSMLPLVNTSFSTLKTSYRLRLLGVKTFSVPIFLLESLTFPETSVLKINEYLLGSTPNSSRPQ